MRSSTLFCVPSRRMAWYTASAAAFIARYAEQQYSTMSTPAVPSSSPREQRRLAELGDVGEHRHPDRVLEAPVHRQIGHRLGKDHVGAGLHAGHGPLDRALDALRRERVGARHDHEPGVRARIDRGLDPVDHLLPATPLPCPGGGRSAWPEPDPRCACPRRRLDEGSHRARDVEGPAPAGVGVHQQRQRRRRR